MPWWGWLLIGIGVVLFIVFVIPLKMKILKKMMNKKEDVIEEDE
jgi:F0F1-type ATP synthase membrane subunit b/b'